MSTDLATLYSNRLLALAADIPHLGRLDNADATIRERAPLCGSTITVDINVENGRITEFAQDVKACALGQAAAAVVGQNVIGRSLPELQRALTEFKAFLKEDGPVPTAPFEGFEALLPARAYKNRHASILLSLTAAHNALAEVDT
ncbi:NifU-like protein involved in Fe-S cluster formation [Pacificibacter maritimus]|uniref:NifU-like protein involved in Fe-S cluster formation n=1 Tax=Pacificibacter maritimus TaxID=762213 RepID=A0A3N4VF08_9RHOB|nr:iron-sulfur cluster assembly scaffold protein [Pacificibacter maritimus]RPE71484.1 NifU-like protein involved in Fe-S cluster formation [Pacificibacter maritimus]